MVEIGRDSVWKRLDSRPHHRCRRNPSFPLLRGGNITTSCELVSCQTYFLYVVSRFTPDDSAKLPKMPDDSFRHARGVNIRVVLIGLSTG